MPSKEQINIPIKAPLSLKNESFNESVFVISPIDFIIFLPPKRVEIDIIVPTKIAKVLIVPNDVFAPVPSKNSNMPMNFCPSCAPCIKEIEAQENISSLLYGRRFFFNIEKSIEVMA